LVKAHFNKRWKGRGTKMPYQGELEEEEIQWDGFAVKERQKETKGIWCTSGVEGKKNWIEEVTDCIIKRERHRQLPIHRKEVGGWEGGTW